MSIPCSKDKIRNPATGKCVLIRGERGQAVLAQQNAQQEKAREQAKQHEAQKSSNISHCPAGKIRNPATGKCVLIRGERGQAIIAEQNAENMRTRQDRKFAEQSTAEVEEEVILKCRKGQKFNKATKDCECAGEDTIKNPETKFCVLRSGKLGKSILEQQKRQHEITIRPILELVKPPSPPVRLHGQMFNNDEGDRDEEEEEKTQTKVKDCPPNKIRNVLTGRCVKLSGAIGSRIGQAPTMIQLPKCKRVVGPMSFSYHKSGTYGKQIIILGDKHTSGASCAQTKGTLDISLWIQRLITDNPYVLFDLFIESDTKASMDKFNKSYSRFGLTPLPFDSSLEKVIGLFADQCHHLHYPNGEGFAVGAARREPDVCSYANTRVHYSDIRTRYLQPYEFIIDNLLILLEHAEVGNEAAIALQTFRLLQSKDFVLGQLRGINAKDYKERCGITDLLSRVNDKRVVEILNREFGHYTKRLEKLDVNLIYAQAEKLAEACLAGSGLDYLHKLLMENKRSALGIFTTEGAVLLVEALSCYMDWYLMAGLFSQFNLTHTAQNLKIHNMQQQLAKKERNTRLKSQKAAAVERDVTQTPEPRVIVIYVGEEHAKKYRKILKLLKFTENALKIADNTDRCIDVTSLGSSLPLTV